MKKIKVVETILGELAELDNGILLATITEPNLNDVALMVSLMDSMEKHFGRNRDVIGDFRLMKSISAETRKFAATQEGLRCFRLSAIVVGGISRIAGNLYLSFNKPPVPTKLFSNVEKAQAWILEERVKRNLTNNQL